MTQTPQTPAGWYPANGMERWWDGNQWSEHTRPIQPTIPQPTQAQPAYGAPQPAYGAPQPGQPAYYPTQPVKKSHTARNILIIMGVLFLLFVGGCFAVIAVVGNEVDKRVNDDTLGGPNNPLTIEAGEGFEVDGFVYADGWAIGPDASGLVAITDLKVTNERDKTDQAFVEIKVLVDDEVIAESTCTSGDRIQEGLTVTLNCVSGDTMPADYDEITINDVI